MSEAFDQSPPGAGQGLSVGTGYQCSVLPSRSVSGAVVGQRDPVALGTILRRRLTDSGLRRMAAEIVARKPRSYRGIDQDPAAVKTVQPIVEAFGDVHTADATETGLSDASVDIVIGEATLTMQGDKAKTAIVNEVVRLLWPGGRYAIHELGLTPDGLADEIKTDVRQARARSIKVGARSLTLAE